jgi:hypothetical protein
VLYVHEQESHGVIEQVAPRMETVFTKQQGLEVDESGESRTADPSGCFDEL